MLNDYLISISILHRLYRRTKNPDFYAGLTYLVAHIRRRLGSPMTDALLLVASGTLTTYSPL